MRHKLIAATLWSALALGTLLPAQTAQTTSFRAVMTSAGGSSVVMDLMVHAVKNTPGNIVSGSIDFNLAYHFLNDEVVTSVGIAGGGVTYSTAIAPIMATAGNGQISGQVQVTASDQIELAILNGLLENPGQYSVTVGAANAADDMSGTV